MTEMLKEMKYRYLFLGVILTCALSLIVSALLKLPSLYATTLSGTLALYGFPLVWMGYYFRKYQLSFRVWLKPVRLKISETMAAAFFPELLGMGILLLITVGITAILPAGGLNELPETNTNWVLHFISAVILAPICEELIFRGFVLNKMLIRFSPAKAVIFSSVIFGALHLTTGISPTIVGVVLCIIYVKYQSIIPGMVIHCIHNLAVVLIKYLASSGVDTTAQMTPADFQPLIILSGVFIALGLVWLVLFIRRNWHYATEFAALHRPKQEVLSVLGGE
ncbi:MAG: CPBP family intramembrane metalloprotease [Acetobacterium woodii]|nr:CPBP family intramembrane metalloprotease [Acetobacterium woodii]